jgi:hypothetical protein
MGASAFYGSTKSDEEAKQVLRDAVEMGCTLYVCSNRHSTDWSLIVLFPSQAGIPQTCDSAISLPVEVRERQLRFSTDTDADIMRSSLGKS